MNNQFKISKSGKRYGTSEYPMTLDIFPQFAGDIEGVKTAMRRNAPGYGPIENLQVSERKTIPGFCEAAIVYHTPDWEMYVEYAEVI